MNSGPLTASVALCLLVAPVPASILTAATPSVTKRGNLKSGKYVGYVELDISTTSDPTKEEEVQVVFTTNGLDPSCPASCCKGSEKATITLSSDNIVKAIECKAKGILRATSEQVTERVEVEKGPYAEISFTVASRDNISESFSICSA